MEQEESRAAVHVFSEYVLFVCLQVHVEMLVYVRT